MMEDEEKWTGSIHWNIVFIENAFMQFIIKVYDYVFDVDTSKWKLEKYKIISLLILISIELLW